MNDLLQRIVIVPGVCGGQPVIRGMRISVADVLGMRKAELSRRHVQCCINRPVIDDISLCIDFLQAVQFTWVAQITEISLVEIRHPTLFDDGSVGFAVNALIGWRTGEQTLF